ncbi:hypothetical protein ARMGADRAFT_1067593 [Armillaria gallica]|uniref:Uncharacterized protein n=1 Tax=Armillaria gallica TaxID=47427 RepID=A0A2H3CPR7_ARMGA|nr:hypothetical protein ARMGADRAFT_1067593 [Armillaria gallica]
MAISPASSHGVAPSATLTTTTVLSSLVVAALQPTRRRNQNTSEILRLTSLVRRVLDSPSHVPSAYPHLVTFPVPHPPFVQPSPDYDHDARRATKHRQRRPVKLNVDEIKGLMLRLDTPVERVQALVHAR